MGRTTTAPAAPLALQYTMLTIGTMRRLLAALPWMKTLLWGTLMQRRKHSDSRWCITSVV